jgi:peptide-methionine (S)-S-oxide reductase
MLFKTFAIFILISFLSACQSMGQNKAIPLNPVRGKAMAAFAEGCFWCSEHIFEAVLGVDSVISGYAGGEKKNPTYQEVGREGTGHAESILVYYDPKIISFDELVIVFFSSHDATTPNRQGPDAGSSYRSVAFYQNDVEKKIIEKTIQNLTEKKFFNNKIVTELSKLDTFYRAEDYHQDYIEHHPNNGYVINVSIPRFNLFRRTYKGKLKD